MSVAVNVKSTMRLVAAFILAGYSAIRAATFLDSIPLDTVPEGRNFVLGSVEGRLNAFYIARGALFRSAVGDPAGTGPIEITKARGAGYSLCFREGILAMTSRNDVGGPRGRLAVFDSRNGFAVLLDTAVQDQSIKEVYVDDGKVYAALSDSGVGIFDFRNGKAFRVHPVSDEIERIRASRGIIFTNAFASEQVMAWRPEGDTLRFLGANSCWGDRIEMDVEGDTLLGYCYNFQSGTTRLHILRYSPENGLEELKTAELSGLSAAGGSWNGGAFYYCLSDGLYSFAKDLKRPPQDTAIPSSRNVKARHTVSGRFAFYGDTLAMMESVMEGGNERCFLSLYRMNGVSGLRPRSRTLRTIAGSLEDAWLVDGRRGRIGGASIGPIRRSRAATPVFAPAP